MNGESSAPLEQQEFGPRGTLVVPSLPVEERIGSVIGRYKLLEKIGEGGFGAVYIAEQREPVRRRVALKLIKPGMDTEQVVARFEAERQALALMDHANIARVFDAGATDNGRPFFVMELVRGVKITEFCDENKLSSRQRIELLIQVCRAIQHAHQKGIIHRDIKPENILVTIHDGAPVPKVIDFGIAKATQGELTDKTIHTHLQQFMGTPVYMSPEQAEMKGMDIDTRTDIYSLGALLYELLTGKPPFDAKELAKNGYDEMRRTIREQEPQPPSILISHLKSEEQKIIARQRRCELAKLIHHLRGDLDWVVMKAMEKDRSHRYETANGLAVDLQRHLNNETVSARPPSTLYRLQKLARRNKLAFTAACGVTIALMAGLGITNWLLVKEKEYHRQALESKRKAQIEAEKSRQVAKFLQDILRGVDPAIASSSDTKLLREILDSTAKRIRSDLAGQPDVEAELSYTLSEVYFAIGDLKTAKEMEQRAVDLQKKAAGALKSKAK